MTNAIILCAGRSELDVKLGYPKCLCNLGEETILERQIRLLKECGINEVYLALGNGADEVADRMMKYRNVKYRTIDWWWQEKGRHYGSFYTAWQFRDKWNDTIILYGDLVYSKKALLEMLNCPLTKYGFMLLLSDEKGTRWSPHEDFGIRMNHKGTVYLKNLEIQAPFCLSIDPHHLYPMHDMQIMALWWYFEWKYGEKFHFTPKGYVQDVDGIEGLELARKRVKRFK